jgi:hypothetical protein
MRKTITAMALIALTGCATTPTPPNTAEQVSPDFIYGFQDRVTEDAGKITVIRDGGFTGSGCDFILYIDGKRAAKIGAAQKVSLYVKPGSINIGSGPISSAICSSAAIKTFATDIGPRQEKLFRLNGDMQGFYLAPYIDYGGK